MPICQTGSVLNFYFKMRAYSGLKDAQSFVNISVVAKVVMDRHASKAPPASHPVEGRLGLGAGRGGTVPVSPSVPIWKEGGPFGRGLGEGQGDTGRRDARKSRRGRRARGAGPFGRGGAGILANEQQIWRPAPVCLSSFLSVCLSAA